MYYLTVLPIMSIMLENNESKTVWYQSSYCGYIGTEFMGISIATNVFRIHGAVLHWLAW